MATRRKLTLINGMMDKEGGMQTYQTTNSFEMLCHPTPLGVPPVPFPDDDDDWDDFDQVDDQAK